MIFFGKKIILRLADENKQRCIESGIDAIINKSLTPINCNPVLNAFIPATQKEKGMAFNDELTDLADSERQLFGLSRFPILDIQEGLKTTGTEKSLYDMLQLMLEHSLTEDMSMLTNAHDQGDWERVRKYAHRIKGGAVYVGALRMNKACHYLERPWQKNQHQLLEKLYQQALHVIDESRTEISAWIKKKKQES